MGRVENSVGKKGKCWLPAFSPFPIICFQMLFFQEVLRVGISGNGLTLQQTKDMWSSPN